MPETETLQVVAGEQEGHGCAVERPANLDFTQCKTGVSTQVTPSDLAEAIRRGWQVNPKRKRKYFKALDQAITDLPKIRNAAKRASVTAQCTRVLVAEQAAAIRDVQHLENLDAQSGMMKLKMERAEQNLPNDSLAVTVQQLPAPTVMPAPEWLKRMGLMSPNDG